MGRKKLSPHKRRFDGKIYGLTYTDDSKRAAQKRADKLRKQGWNARVISRKPHGKTYYYVYRRRKKGCPRGRK